MDKATKDHLIATHTAMATHHTSCAKCFKTMMGSCEDGTPAHDFHKGMLAAHTDQASHHIDCVKALDAMPAVTTETNLGTNFDGKALTASNAAMMADDLTRRFDQAEPMRAHGALGDVPDSSLRLVNRVGGAPINSDPVADLDAQLAKLGPRQAIV